MRESFASPPELESPRENRGVAELVERSERLLLAGELQQALAAAEKADVLTRRATCPDAQRANVLFRLGAAQYKLARDGEAVASLSLALNMAEKPPFKLALAAEIVEWRSRAYRRQRDFAAAALDCDRGIRYAERLGDPHRIAHLLFQASLVAERSGDKMSARDYAQRALERFEHVGDTLSIGRVLNNLGGIAFLLGEHDEARELISRAHQLLAEAGYDAEAGQALSSLAQVELGAGEPERAIKTVERALALMGDRADFIDETGSALLVSGRAMMALCRFGDSALMLARAETLFRRIGSVGHQAAVWLALGDLSLREGDHLGAVPHYRRAAAAMQDVHF